MDRREALKLSLLVGAGLAGTATQANAAQCEGDGTPAQFIPRKAADAKPQDSDIEKSPKCPYCGMDRKQFHHSRMVVHFSDDLYDGVCSLHCAAISLSVNLDRDPKALWVADNAAAGEIKPLIEVDKASFLVGSSLKGVMTKRSKVAFGSADAAKAAQSANGGELANFDQALLAAYSDMANDVSMIRKMRAERRKKMMEQGGMEMKH
jgi:copper chaperone NosL